VTSLIAEAYDIVASTVTCHLIVVHFVIITVIATLAINGV